MKEIKYVGYYDVHENCEENRVYVPAATNKMAYILSALNRAGFAGKIISMSATKNRHGYKGKMLGLDEYNTLQLFRTFPWGNKLRRIISVLSMRLFIFLYLLTNTKKNENVMVYHSLGYADIIRWAKKIKKFRLILEVEEIYADVNGRERDRRKEYKIFRQADAFLFSTELLNVKLNAKNKPYAIIYGTYRIEGNQKCKCDDGKIHVVYAGTLDPRKGGAIAAAAAAAYLNKSYHLHIIGFGGEKDKSLLLHHIADIEKSTACTITYDGILYGEEYIRFLQCCDIGLSTQTPNASFNDTSFPSKVLSYLSNYLQVVSIRIDALSESKLAPYLHFYDEATPQSIADAILSIDLNNTNSPQAVLSELDNMFVEQMKALLYESDVLHDENK